MGRKRKRHSSEKRCHEDSSKRIKITEDGSAQRQKVLVNYPVLPFYYPHVSSLRDYLLFKLPLASRSSRRKIKPLSTSQPFVADAHGDPLSTLLDSVVIGYFDNSDQSVEDARRKELTQYSQTQLNQTVGSIEPCHGFSQSEIVDFAVWTLFTKTFKHLQGHWKKVPHLLCHGSERCTTNGIDGIVAHYPNQNVAALKGSPWTEVLNLLGSKGDGIMLGLLLDCGVFVPVESGRGNLCQLSGLLLWEVPLLNHVKEVEGTRPCDGPGESISTPHSPGAILLTHSRIFYARPALDGKGQVRFGLRYSHVLNRYPDADDPVSTVHIMKYIFPRQFGLHNVFTCSFQKREGLREYTNREEEIVMAQETKELKTLHSSSIGPSLQLPSRLRGHALGLVQGLQRRHNRCPYVHLLRHYCPKHDVQNRWAYFQTEIQTSSSDPTQSTKLVTQETRSSAACPRNSMAATTQDQPDSSMMDLATPAASVSAFCRAVLNQLIPRSFFGLGDAGMSNWKTLMKAVDKFINLRRRETLSLHEVCQGVKTSCVEWVISPKQSRTSKASKSDTEKRMEIFREFVYYMFDSLLIPLIRSNFYVTESGVHSNRLFFFRHDIWRSISEPSMASLKLLMLEEMKTKKAEEILRSRSLGFSQLRLLPKARGARPIINFKKQNPKKVNGEVVHKKAINKVLEPVHTMLTYEKRNQPDRLGSSMFSQGEMYHKLKAYKSRLMTMDTRDPRLYFVKVDVKSCFDTIPQTDLLKVVRQLISEEEYRMPRYAFIRPPESRFEKGSRKALKPIQRWKCHTHALDDFTSFYDTVNERLAPNRKRAVFVESGGVKVEETKTLLGLLDEHVKANIVKIGERFYRQKRGIPQGSILSSILCNFFYGDMEREKLDFLDRDSILLRHTDDFLLVTTNRKQARQFLQLMHDGHPEYGISVNPTKSLVNFEVTINGMKVARCGGPEFAYLGDCINTRTLAVSTDGNRKKQTVISDLLTVETSRNPGKHFTRRILDGFKHMIHARFLDTAFNTVATVMMNIYQSFVLTGMKCFRYIKSLPTAKQPHVSLVIKTIADLIWLAYNLIESMKTELASQGYECALSKSQIQWLASRAFLSVLSRKQSKFQPVLAWLNNQAAASKPRTREDAMQLLKAIRIGAQAYQDFKY